MDRYNMALVRPYCSIMTFRLTIALRTPVVSSLRSAHLLPFAR
jgi:hypothetical protein